MKKRKGFGQLIITIAFVYSALLCHFHASELRENGDMLKAILYWFFGATALAGAFRFKIAFWIERIIYQDGFRGSVVDHYKVFGGEHTWFNNQDINSSELIWEFFSNHDINGYID